MRATIDAVTGRVSMYRLATASLVVVLALGVVLAFLDIILAQPKFTVGDHLTCLQIVFPTVPWTNYMHFVVIKAHTLICLVVGDDFLNLGHE